MALGVRVPDSVALCVVAVCDRRIGVGAYVDTAVPRAGTKAAEAGGAEADGAGVGGTGADGEGDAAGVRASSASCAALSKAVI